MTDTKNLSKPVVRKSKSWMSPRSIPKRTSLERKNVKTAKFLTEKDARLRSAKERIALGTIPTDPYGFPVVVKADGGYLAQVWKKLRSRASYLFTQAYPTQKDYASAYGIGFDLAYSKETPPASSKPDNMEDGNKWNKTFIENRGLKYNIWVKAYNIGLQDGAYLKQYHRTYRKTNVFSSDKKGSTVLEMGRRTPPLTESELTASFQESLLADGAVHFTKQALETAYLETKSPKSRATLILMSPEHFLMMAKNLIKPDDYKQNRVANVPDLKFNDIPQLLFTHDGQGHARVEGHEGRHRMMLLRSKGVHDVPVLFKSLENGEGKAIRWGSQDNIYDKVSVWPTVLYGEESHKMIDFPESMVFPRNKNLEAQNYDDEHPYGYWLTDDGKQLFVNYEAHEKVAKTYLMDHRPSEMKEIQESTSVEDRVYGFFTDYVMQKLGWIRLMKEYPQKGAPTLNVNLIYGATSNTAYLLLTRYVKDAAVKNYYLSVESEDYTKSTPVKSGSIDSPKVLFHAVKKCVKRELMAATEEPYGYWITNKGELLKVLTDKQGHISVLHTYNKKHALSLSRGDWWVINMMADYWPVLKQGWIRIAFEKYSDMNIEFGKKCVSIAAYKKLLVLLKSVKKSTFNIDVSTQGRMTNEEFNTPNARSVLALVEKNINTTVTAANIIYGYWIRDDGVLMDVGPQDHSYEAKKWVKTHDPEALEFLKYPDDSYKPAYDFYDYVTEQRGWIRIVDLSYPREKTPSYGIDAVYGVVSKAAYKTLVKFLEDEPSETFQVGVYSSKDKSKNRSFTTDDPKRVLSEIRQCLRKDLTAMIEEAECEIAAKAIFSKPDILYRSTSSDLIASDEKDKFGYLIYWVKKGKKVVFEDKNWYRLNDKLMDAFEKHFEGFEEYRGAYANGFKYGYSHPIYYTFSKIDELETKLFSKKQREHLENEGYDAAEYINFFFEGVQDGAKIGEYHKEYIEYGEWSLRGPYKTIVKLHASENSLLKQKKIGLFDSDSYTNKTNSVKLIFYSNRSTAQTCKPGQTVHAKAGYGKRTKVRSATPEEVAQLKKGIWLRTRENGAKASDTGAKKSKYRPWLVASAQNRINHLLTRMEAP